MDDGGAPGRIEIELTAHDDPARARRWRRGAADTPPPPLIPASHSPSIPADAVVTAGVDPGSGGDRTGGVFGSERGRLAVAALAAGVVALFVGWAVGRSGGDDELASKGPESESVAPSTEPASTLGGPTLAPVAEELLPTTTRAPRPTTTVPQQVWVTTQVAVDARIAELGLEIVGVSQSGGFVQLDTSTGALSTYPGRFRSEYGPVPVMAGDEWFVVADPNTGQTSLVRGFDDPEPVDLSAYESLHLGDTDEFIEFEVVFNDETEQMLRVYRRTLGERREIWFESPIPPNFWVTGGDPAGGVLVASGSSSTYTIGPDGSSRLTQGLLLGLSAELAVVQECGETIDDCAAVMIDRQSGERRVISDLVDTSHYQPLYGWFGAASDTISPEGDRIVVVDAVGDYRTGVLSLDDASFVALPILFDGNSTAWVAGGRYLLFLAAGELRALDVATGETFTVADDAERMASFDVRPAG